MTERNSANTWSGDWRARLRERLEEAGCSTLSEFFDAHPIWSLRQLAERLGADVAPVQLTAAFLTDAKARGCVRSSARDLLARRIIARLPNGWEAGETGLSPRAAALGAWRADMEMFAGEYLAERARAVCSALKANAREGWRPSGADDSVLVAAFDGGRPA